MKLKELNEAIATTCNVRPNVVSSVQAETFKQLRAAIEKGERVVIPEFGQFSMRDVPAEGDTPAKKIIKFRGKKGEGKSRKEGKEKGARKEKHKEKTEAAPGGEGDK